MGLDTEPRILIRGCFENAFCIAALVNNPAELMNALQEDDKAARKAQAKFIVAESDRMEALDEKSKQRLQRFASTAGQQWGKVRQLAIDETAKGTALKDAYLYYRMLSNDAAHPSMTSLGRHFNREANGQWDYKHGAAPADQIASTINIACWAIMSTLVSFTQLVNDAEGNREVARAVDAFSRVNEAMLEASKSGPT